MTPREIVLEQIHHRETKVVPYSIDFEEDVAKRLDAHYGNPDWRNRLEKFIVGTGVVDTTRKKPIDREGYARDPYGSIWRLDRRPFHLETPGLTQPSFDGYRWPKPEEFFLDEKGVADARRTFEENRKQSFTMAGLGWGLFETSWGIRGFENVLVDAIAEPDFFEELLDRLTGHFLAYLDFSLQCLPDVDAIMFGDDWGDQRGVIVGNDRWRKYFKPRYAKIYAAAHARGKVVISHCCGSIADILPDVIEIGLDVLESCQPEARGMNPCELKKKFGKNITFWGCIGSQSIIPMGTPEQIQKEVKRLKREMSKGGGFILAPAKTLQPETPTENAVAMVEAFAGK
jgi:uroporphyrinogen decarboxylase